MKNSSVKFKETEIGPIPEEWGVLSVGDVGKVVTGKTPPTKHTEYFGDDYLFIKIPDMADSMYITKTESGLTQAGADYLQKTKLPKNSVMVSCIATVGHVGITTKESFTNQQINSVIPNLNVIDPKYLYYFFTGSKEYLTSLGGGGSVYTNISKSKFENMAIAVPQLNEQNNISEILSSLDDKIELNRQINANLEKMASALFKRWFVDFEFPDENGQPYKSSGGKMVESEMDEIPEGWRVAQLGGVANIIDCLHAKKPDRAESGNGCILLQLNNIGSNGLLDMKEKYIISELDYKKWISRMEATEGDCVITNVGRVGAFSRIPAGERAALGRNMTGIRNKDSFPFDFFLAQYFLSDLYKTELSRNIDVGTILDALNVRNIPMLRLIIPTDTLVLEKAEDIFSSVWQLKENNMKNGHHLTEMRDSLLPRLMSGKMRVL